MKTTKHTFLKPLRIGILALSLPILIGCSGFLEVIPVGKTTTPVFFSDMNGIRAAINGAYAKVYSYYNSEFYRYPEVAGNTLELNNDKNMLNVFNFASTPDEDGAAVGQIWMDIYEAMSNINNILYYLPSLEEKFPGNRAELAQIKAQALFLRALCHFDVCRVYAQPYNYTAEASHPGVPVLLKTPEFYEYIERKPVHEVYAQIVSDLTASIQTFGSTAQVDVYHASKRAAQALLSRVYLYMEDWDKSIQYADSVLKTVPLSYGDDYLKMFSYVSGNEAILRLNSYNLSQNVGTFYSPTRLNVIVSDTLYSLFNDPADIRLRLFWKNGTARVSLKYRDSVEHLDPILLRASELYLNRAEAYLNKNLPDSAVKNMLVLMSRNLATNSNNIQLTNDPAQLELLIKKERLKELCFEGHCFFDITRRKENLARSASTGSSILFLPYPNDLFVLPIPQKELDTNPKMTKNPTVNN
jgi:starch-binding outer membrane protein, SusD/RagB family